MLNYFFAFLCLASVLIFPQSKEQLLKSRIDSLLKDNFFQSTQIAVDVYDLTARETLYQKNEKLLLNPASNLKLLTTAAALDYLGDSYKFETSVYYTGRIINGTLYGDIYLKGGCDPEFDTDDLDSLANSVISAGIKNISGNIYGDVSMVDSLFWGKGWMWDDDPSPDAPYLSSLDINKNSFGVIVKPSDDYYPPDIIPVPENGFVKIENEALTVPADSPQTVKINRDWINRENTVTVKGNVRNVSIPDSLVDTLRVNVYSPGLYFLNLFKETLVKKSVGFNGSVSFMDTPVYADKIFSLDRLLKDVVPDINKNSYNLGAEMLIYALAAKFFGTPAHAGKGIYMVDSLICEAGCDPSLYSIVDGSGISRYNLLTAELIVAILKYIYYNKPSLFKTLYASLPVAGRDGTLKDRMAGTPAENNVHAKTGTLRGVTTLSGYLTSNNGDILAFSILIQNFIGDADMGRNFQNQICNYIIDY